MAITKMAIIIAMIIKVKTTMIMMITTMTVIITMIEMIMIFIIIAFTLSSLKGISIFTQRTIYISLSIGIPIFMPIIKFSLYQFQTNVIFLPFRLAFTGTSQSLLACDSDPVLTRAKVRKFSLSSESVIKVLQVRKQSLDNRFGKKR